MIKQVKEPPAGHRELILGFNTFLPKGYEIKLSPEPAAPQRGPSSPPATTYVNKTGCVRAPAGGVGGAGG